MNDKGHPDSEAWSAFWAQNAHGGRGADSTGCLPQRWAAIEEAQRAVWSGFAEDLPKGARLLDLATGDGRILGWLAAERDDLSLVGVDLAPILPPSPAGATTQGGVAMEDLPFADRSFAAVTSQFGFEYGDIPRVAREVARVLQPSGRVGLLVHRGDGPILAHNLARKEQIEWAIAERATIAKAKSVLASGGGFQAAHDQVARVVAEGAKLYGQGSPAWEIPEAVRRSIVMGSRAGTQSVIETLDAIAYQANNEIGRIDSLARACAAADDRDALLSAMAAAGLQLKNDKPIGERSGRAFADFLEFA